MCGEAGVSALRFHLCNLLSIVQDYYQLFNNSGDIYQGQLCRAVSCREDGLSVILLHSQAANERLFNWGRKPLAGGTCFHRECPHIRSQGLILMPNAPFKLTFRFKLVRPPFLLRLLVNVTTELHRPNSRGLSEAAQDCIEAKCQQCSSQPSPPTGFSWVPSSKIILTRHFVFTDGSSASPCFPAFILNITALSWSLDLH